MELNARDSGGITPLGIAFGLRRARFVKSLVSAGATVELALCSAVTDETDEDEELKLYLKNSVPQLSILSNLKNMYVLSFCIDCYFQNST